MASPHNCPECQRLFLTRPLLRDTVRRTALLTGTLAATALVEHRLAEEHIEHEHDAEDRQLRKEREAKWRGYE
ncbi:MAG: hypothetical protein GY906_10355 [bacterium]|nr:hypothetical protein [bacterium]